MLDLKKIRSDFPILNNNIVYFDNASTTQRPFGVIEAMNKFYYTCNGSVAKGLYKESVDASKMYEEARLEVAKFIGASFEEVVFCSNATDGLNIISNSININEFNSSDEVVVSVLEHHSNYLPWQMFAKKNGIKLSVMKCDADGKMRDEDLSIINSNTKIVAITYESNVLGQLSDIKKISELAHMNGAIVVADASQAIMHTSVNVKKDGVDALVFSGHKMVGPLGIGVLFVDKKIHDIISPIKVGGGMVSSIEQDNVSFMPMPFCLESGTCNVAGAIGLAEAMKYIGKIGYEAIRAHEEELMKCLISKFEDDSRIRILGSIRPTDHYGVLSLDVDKWHPHDLSACLAEKDIAVRAGVHCAYPIHQYMGVTSSLRISTAFYNTLDEVEYLTDTIDNVLNMA